MGKGAMLLVMATMIGGSIMLFQADQTGATTDKRQAERQEEVLAREIARSGYNAIISRARKVEQENPAASVGQIVNLVNGANGQVTGAYQGGNYAASLTQVSALGYSVTTTGYYGEASHRMRSHWVADGTLEVTQPSELKVTFEESMAGYCSAIFLERFVPKNNNGHGNNEDGVDSSNPGNSKEGEDSDPTVDDEVKVGSTKYKRLEPALIFAPGNNRDGAEALFTTVLQPGERINFILAVDADFNCEDRGETVTIKDKSFNYTRAALTADVSDLVDMQEGIYAMIESNPVSGGAWRIAFEDLIFPNDKLADVKKNGYGGSWNSQSKTYGGSGWSSFDINGFRMLQDFGNKPDFSDQVIQVELIPTTTTQEESTDVAVTE